MLFFLEELSFFICYHVAAQKKIDILDIVADSGRTKAKMRRISFFN
jgi:hypothetical protein